MPCYNPIRAWQHTTKRTENGKSIIEFAKGKNEIRNKDLWEMIKLPCGQCTGCRLEYSRQWAMRCVLESQLYEHNYFLTLTYDEENIPQYGQLKIDPETGEVTREIASLNYKHIQKFLKDLRRFYEYHYHHKGIRYFGCGDYGKKTMRPHYHIILFNLPIFDLKPADPKKIKCKSEYPLYESYWIEKIWGKGTVAIGEVNFETCAYTARYMLEKHKGKDRTFYDDHGIEPIKSICSRRPGIGGNYWIENKDHIVEYDKIQICTRNKVISVMPPKYYDRLFDAENSTMADIVKNKRKEEIQEAHDILLEQKALTENQYDYVYLKNEEDKVIAKIKALKRSL